MILLSSLSLSCSSTQSKNQSQQKYVIKDYYAHWDNWLRYGQIWFVLPNESNCRLSCPVCSETNELDCAVCVVWIIHKCNFMKVFPGHISPLNFFYFNNIIIILLFYNIKNINYKLIYCLDILLLMFLLFLSHNFGKKAEFQDINLQFWNFVIVRYCINSQSQVKKKSELWKIAITF